MAEIDGKLRFYFVFRPYIYKDLEGLLSLKMRLNLSEVDVIVYNDSKRTRRILPLVRKSARPQEIDLTQFFQYMYRLTIRDTGRWFGADNPSIPLPPDFHPCMPGVPDDEADVLLLMLRHGLWALHTGEKGTG
ncbi:unnamed protein product [Symbiodinium microadriaticum]|nr:unnamed protein product [Symbiodinium microadriaticum]